MVTANILVEHLKTIGHLVSMGKPACHALVGVADQGNELFMYSIVSQYYHNCLSVHGVEYFLEVDEVISIPVTAQH